MRAWPPQYSRMICPRPRNCSGVRSPRVTLTWTVEKPSWRCGWTLASRKRANAGAVAVGRAVGMRHLGAHRPARRRGTRGPRSRSRARRPSRPRGSSSTIRRLVDADLVDQHLQAGAGAVDAQPVLAVEDAQDGLGPHQVGAVVGRDELVQGRGDARHDRRAAADADLEALHAVALARDEGDVVDAGQRAVGAAAAVEGGLDLARHQLRRGVAHEVAHERARVGRRVEELVGADAGPRVGGHVAHGVAAALAAGEPGLASSRM